MQISTLLKSINLNEFVAFDLESTGLNANTDSIIEISAYRFIDGLPHSTFTTLINPNRTIPVFITELTGINNSMVKKSPFIKDALPDLLEFFGNSPIVGQNIGFDFGFLNNALAIENKPLYKNSRIYDTSTLSRFCLFTNDDLSLSGISDFYGLNTDGAHRAEMDTLNTGKVFVELIKETACNTIEQLEQCVTTLKNENSYNYYLFKNLVELQLKSNSVNGIGKSELNSQLNSSFFKFENNESEIDKLDIGLILDEGGLIEKNWDKFESRKNQVSFSEDILSSFNQQQILLGEAGTGLGKSFSYLTASLIYSLQNKIPVIISTYTKHLQDQLFNKDIPNFSKLTGIPVTAIILKGRHNYLCKTRLEQFVKYRLPKLNKKDRELFLPIISWSKNTLSGDIEECPAFPISRALNIWNAIRSEPGFCTTSRCKDHDGCFYGPIRKKTSQVNLIIVNHALFCIELNRENSILPSGFVYVIDEGHNFVKSARDQLTIKLNADSANEVISFYKFETDLFGNTIIKAVSQHACEYTEHVNEIADYAIKLKKYIDTFFSEFSKKSNSNGELSNLQYEKNFILNNATKIYDKLSYSPENCLDEILSFSKLTKSLENSLKSVKDFPQSLIIELSSQNKYLEDLAQTFLRISHLLDEDIVWSSFRNRFGQVHCSINCAPKDVGVFLRDALFGREAGGVICSATLALNSSFQFTKDSMGISDSHIVEKLNTVEYKSPFFYEDQVELWVYDSFDKVNSFSFIQTIGNQINELAQQHNNRILVLCTSYDQVKKLRDIVKPCYDYLGRKVFAQTIGHSRRAMIRGYTNTPSSILLGTMSFWEGVDFPGELVEILMIFKIPFDNPTDPILLTEVENYKKKGKNPFMDFQIPTATVKFKQGFGRLIRSINDNGMCILTDPRLLKAQYGKFILNALPLAYKPYKSISEINNSTILFRKETVNE